MKTVVRYYQVDRAQISFVKFILEAYDNMAVLSTLAAAAGLVQISIAPGCEPLVTDIMNSFAGAFSVTRVTSAAPHELPPAWSVLPANKVK